VKENFAETMRQLSAGWRNMTEQEKDRYRNAAARQSVPGGRSNSKTRGGGRRSSQGSGGAARQRRSTSVSLRHHADPVAVINPFNASCSKLPLFEEFSALLV